MKEIGINHSESSKIINSSSIYSALFFLLTHVAYFIFFIIVKVYPLIYINVASIAFYCLMFVLIKNKAYTAYAFLTLVEIAIYMTISTILVGFDSGFSICLIGECSLLFFVGYFSKYESLIIKPVWFSLAFLACFLFSYFWLKYNRPMYHIDDIYETILLVTHVLIVFVFITVFLSILTSYTVKLEKTVQKDAETDKLTAIANRNGLFTYYNGLEDQKENYIVAIFDIDNFKLFNDVNGHLCGDYILTEIARLAKENSEKDFVSRWGGEEFVIISKIENSLEETYKKLERIRKTIAEHDFVYFKKVLHCTITLGAATFQNDLVLDTWIRRADEKLYYGKKNGKNQLVY